MSKVVLKKGDYTVEAFQEYGPFSPVQLTVYDDCLQAVVPPSLYDTRAMSDAVVYTIVESLEDFRRLVNAVEQLVFVDNKLGV